MADIKGYRELSQADLYRINILKDKAEEVRVCIEGILNDPSVDARWRSIGVTHLQQGFMALTRAIAQPTTF